MRTCIYLILTILLFATNYCTAQNIDSLASPIKDIPSKYYAQVDKKINSVDEQLTKKSIKYLTKFRKQEAKLQRKMQKLHPEFVIDSPTEKDESHKKIKRPLIELIYLVLK